jgi:hypothetical protein
MLLSLSVFALSSGTKSKMGIFQEVLLPFSDHAGVKVVFGTYLVKLFVTL